MASLWEVMEPGWIVVLSGSSSSGKSTLGRALLELLTKPCVLVEADAAFPALNQAAGLARTPPVVAFHQSVAVWSAAGHHVIVDGSLPYGDHQLRQHCLAALPADDTFVIAVSCQPAELRRRAAGRADPRQSGWAEQQAADVNDGLEPLISIDTTHGSPAGHAYDVLAALSRARGGG